MKVKSNIEFLNSIINNLKLNNMEAFGKFMTVVLALIITPIITGFGFVKLWAWFIVPTFNMHTLRIVEAIGLMMIIGFVRAKQNNKDEDEDAWQRFIKTILFTVIMSAIVLFFGWIVSMFM